MASRLGLPFVWEVNNEGIVSHAVGTNHASGENYQLAVRFILEGKRRLFLELNPENIPLETTLRLVSYRWNHIFEHLTPQEASTFVRINRTTVENLRERSILLYQCEILQRLYPGCVPLEGTLVQIAGEKEIPIHELETVEENAQAALCGLAYYPQFIRRNVKAAPRRLSIAQAMKSLGSAYAKGSETEIADLAEGYTYQDEQQRERDRRLAQRSFPLLTEPSVIALGAMHFLEPGNVLDWYRKSGLKVQRVQ